MKQETATSPSNTRPFSWTHCLFPADVDKPSTSLRLTPLPFSSSKSVLSLLLDSQFNNSSPYSNGLPSPAFGVHRMGGQTPHPLTISLLFFYSFLFTVSRLLFLLSLYRIFLWSFRIWFKSLRLSNGQNGEIIVFSDRFLSFTYDFCMRACMRRVLPLPVCAGSGFVALARRCRL